jgi:hypothetical protein
MKRNTVSQSAALVGFAAFGLALVTGGFSNFAAAQDAPLTEAGLKRAEQKKPEYSPYPDQHFPTRVFWGDTHHHTRLTSRDRPLVRRILGHLTGWLRRSRTNHDTVVVVRHHDAGSRAVILLRMPPSVG